MTQGLIDFIRTAPPADWLQKIWYGTKRRGLNTLTYREIDAEIRAYRTQKPSTSPRHSE